MMFLASSRDETKYVGRISDSVTRQCVVVCRVTGYGLRLTRPTELMRFFISKTHEF